MFISARVAAVANVRPSPTRRARTFLAMRARRIPSVILRLTEEAYVDGYGTYAVDLGPMVNQTKFRAAWPMVPLLAALLACAEGGGGDDPQAALTKKCGGDHDLESTCKSQMRWSLKDPSSADFASIFNSGFSTATNCTQTYSSFVEAKNGLGLVVRTNFSCTYNPKTKAVTLKVAR